MADEQTNIRLPAALKRRLEEEANQGRRTFTAEVVSRLERTFAEPSSTELRDQILKERAAFNDLQVLASERARTIQGLQVTRDLLASFLCDIDNLLPQDKRAGPGVQNLVRFARSVINRDVDALRDAFADMTPGRTEQVPYPAMLSAMTQSLTVPPIDPSAPPAPAAAGREKPRKR
jgi:hypothetical protein